MQKEVEYGNSVVITILNILAKVLKWLIQVAFSIVVVVLDFISKVIKKMFLENFEVFGFLTDTILERRAKKRLEELEDEFDIECLTKHVYTFQRSQVYDENYNAIKDMLKDFSDNNVAMNDDIAEDILKKIAVMTVEVEKKALEEGYSYAAFTKYRFSDQDEIYDNFIEYKILRGEGEWQD